MSYRPPDGAGAVVLGVSSLGLALQPLVFGDPSAEFAAVSAAMAVGAAALIALGLGRLRGRIERREIQSRKRTAAVFAVAFLSFVGGVALFAL